MSWRMAKALGATGTEGLLGEINAAHPARSMASDGGIGDARHRARTSDHNPCPCCRIVHARDFTHDPEHGFDGHAFADWLAARVRDGTEQRVKYIISNRRIAGTRGVWRPYKGANPHTSHVHVSVQHGRADDPASWGYPPPPP